MSQSKHTPGPWVKYDSPPQLTDARLYRSTVVSLKMALKGMPTPTYKQTVKNTKTIGGNLMAITFGRTKMEAEANANLIAEAGTVATEFGLTPRQLLDQRNEMLEALEFAPIVSEYNTCESFIKAYETWRDRYKIPAIIKATGE